MTEATAAAIANLINAHNQLSRGYTAEDVLAEQDNYIVRMRDGGVIAVVEVKKVQWYQCEVSHLSVDSTFRGAGIGRSLVQEAEERARRLGARIAQCSIRVGNTPSEAVFAKCGFLATVTFRNARTGNNVTVYQKVL
jgi:ribosomal protein S18 acetylase RimI-like enzyme